MNTPLFTPYNKAMFPHTSSDGKSQDTVSSRDSLETAFSLSRSWSWSLLLRVTVSVFVSVLVVSVSVLVLVLLPYSPFDGMISVPAERTFAQSGIIIWPHQASMSDELLDMLMFLKCNA